MTARESLLQAGREWVKAVGGGLADDRVRLEITTDKANHDPDEPYYVVRLYSFDQTVGVDEFADKQALGLDPESRVDRGQRTAMFRVAGINEGSDELLSLLPLYTHLFPKEAYCIPIGPLIDITGIEGVVFEERYYRDFRLTYTMTVVQNNPTGPVAAERFEGTVNNIQFEVP